MLIATTSCAKRSLPPVALSIRFVMGANLSGVQNLVGNPHESHITENCIIKPIISTQLVEIGLDFAGIQRQTVAPALCLETSKNGGLKNETNLYC